MAADNVERDPDNGHALRENCVHIGRRIQWGARQQLLDDGGREKEGQGELFIHTLSHNALSALVDSGERRKTKEEEEEEETFASHPRLSSWLCKGESARGSIPGSRR